MKLCIFLMGPTASGKTDLAVSLVKHLPCDIISVDSAMVYQGMNIGTAKPPADILAIAPHRLIDIRDPVESYSVGQFCTDALAEIQAIQSANRIPLLVGGTMLYFHSLLEGLSNLPSANAQVRERLNREAEHIGWPAMHQRLAQIDPQAAQRIHPNDAQRIQRALEVYNVSGYSMTAWYNKAKAQRCEAPLVKIVIAPEQRSVLHVRIAQRFNAMLNQGLIEEVRSLFERGDLNSELPSMRCVGYRQVWHYLAGELSYTDLPEKAIIATRQMAKRQMTWLRAQKEAYWFDSLSPNLTQQVLKLWDKIHISEQLSVNRYQ
ncbi:MAG: tRNA (adenosine(37)-N6)-dimethylallyltransferase MiaA [Candidatus Parabeggiatoa sp. nov. 3]|nr:MAG: tRNA (adenosine(37)-N6)-dimethylallyltransferase MiaA [Gammaproteobacteria bacterium]RKZ68754.1 MAG: tRNA (adenosine(37)-N6)-dimethylallyltransferase MiaA [Gammaproteobacteria bacterium]RKZ86788.1 MAG: tRNA (adenosine(37)-N6)-dimethylallyltransferase MiaA [Gammaproteobacteria bacterium]HEW97124.1 tRNA (adenosine(37)-N6)-dimethylallyltransferase MiaA [Beggiatoa sp.]